MSDVESRDRIEELIGEALYSINEQAVAAAEEAVRAADLLGDEPLAYEARLALIQAGVFSGYAERALVAFAWCRAYAKAHPGEVDRKDLVWRYKWVVQNLPAMVEVPRARIEAVIADFAEEAAAWGPSSVRSLRVWVAQLMGDLEKLPQLFDVWRDTPRDAMSDCEACERALEVGIWIELGQDRKALLRAAPLVRGEMSCGEVPHFTYGRLLSPLLRLGKPELAADYHKRGYAMIRKNRDFLGATADHMAYLVRIGDLSKAVTLFERHTPWTLDSRDAVNTFRFSAGALALFDALAKERPKPLRLRLSKGAPGYREDGVYDPAAMRSLMSGKAGDLAAKLDARNGNTRYAQKLREALEPLPEPKRAKKAAPSGTPGE